MRTISIIIILLNTLSIRSQTYPTFGSEITVTVNGLTFDAMEPFISPDGTTLFFNNENDAVTTKLFYATRINDSTFNYIGELNGTNQTITPYFDAVADIDLLNNFYWTSTRQYPAQLDNLHHGLYNAGNVINIGRVHGDFYNYSPGWILMDHGISYDGQQLYFNNARFDGSNCSGPCETEMGIAQKVNDSVFAVLSNSASIMQTVNDTNFKFYAPCITEDNLELYYTRFPSGTITGSTDSEICVVVRSSPNDNFSVPQVLFSDNLITSISEGPTLTANKQIMYYHKRIGSVFKIMMRYRENILNVTTSSKLDFPFSIYPNPTNGKLNIKTELNYDSIVISIYTLLGELVVVTTNKTEIDINSLSSGTYYLKLEMDEFIGVRKLIKKE